MSRIRSLFEGEELLRRIIDAVPGGVVHVSKEGAIRDANPEALRILGHHFDEVTKRYISDWDPETLHEDGSPCPVADYPVAQVLATGKPSGPKTIGVRRPDGVVVWAVFRAVPVFDADRNLDGAIVTFLDITERKRAEEERSRSEERWRSLAANIPDFLVTADSEMRMRSANHIGAPLVDEAQILGMSLLDWIEEGYREDYRRAFEEAIESRTMTRIETRRIDQAVWYDVMFVPLLEAGSHERVLVVARDITDRKRAEQAIQASAENWRRLISSLPDHVVIFDRDRRITSLNRPTEGRTEADVVGHLGDAFVDETMVDDFRTHFATALETATSVRYEIRGRTARGTLTWYDAVLVPLAENGVVERVMLVARDITRQRAMLASLAEKERLASVGMVAASVAHEIMNPLTYVLANLDFAIGERGADESRRTKALADAREGAKRMQQIVWDLRALGRAGGEELFYVDACSVLETALRLAGPEVARAARVNLHLERVPGVYASESRLCQVFINLLVNAAQSMEARPPSEREIEIRTRHDEAAGLVAVDVADHGEGITADRIERIFEPFYTTKGSGTGLGLSISKDIVERMGGRIDVKSRAGDGTTFTVWLPTTRTAASSSELRVRS